MERQQLTHDVLTLLHNPIFALVGGIAVAEALYKAEFLDQNFTRMIEGGIVGMSIAAAAKEAGFIGAGLAGGGMAAGSIASLGTGEKLALLGGPIGQGYAALSSLMK